MQWIHAFLFTPMRQMFSHELAAPSQRLIFSFPSLHQRHNHPCHTIKHNQCYPFHENTFSTHIRRLASGFRFRVPSANVSHNRVTPASTASSLFPEFRLYSNSQGICFIPSFQLLLERPPASSGFPKKTNGHLFLTLQPSPSASQSCLCFTLCIRQITVLCICIDHVYFSSVSHRQIRSACSGNAAFIQGASEQTCFSSLISFLSSIIRHRLRPRESGTHAEGMSNHIAVL